MQANAPGIATRLTICILIACCAGCGGEPKPTAVATFTIALTPQADTGDKALDEAINAALRPLADYDFKSASAVEQLISDLDLDAYMNDAPHTQVVRELTAALSVTRQDHPDGTSTVTVGLRTKNPQDAGHIVNHAVQIFQQAISTAWSEAATKEALRLVAEMQRLQDDVIKLEQLAVRVESDKSNATDVQKKAQAARTELNIIEKRQRRASEVSYRSPAGEQAMKFKFTQRATEPAGEFNYSAP